MDNKLVRSFFNKEDWAVKRLYEQYSRLVKHIAYDILHDNSLGDDVVNETFIHLLNRGHLENSNTFLAYMCETAKNISLNILKERNRYEYLNQEVAVQEEISNNLLDILRNNLDEVDYNVLVLRAVLEYPFNDIAELYRLTSSSVRGIYHRSKKKAQVLLRDLL